MTTLADRVAPRRVRLRSPWVVGGGCLALAVASLVLPAALAYDSWAWLVWGREVGRLDLATVGGPSWKPLPVLVTTAVAPFGDLAPTLWLVAARTGALLAVVGVYRLAARFAGWPAGIVAAAMLWLTPDSGPRFVRLFLEGHTAPVTAALAVWAIDRHLDRRYASAFVLVAALALDRPEAWPFLVVYAAWLWRTQRASRGLVVGAFAVLGVLWFGADWWGSGSPLHGADAARVSRDDPSRLLDGLRRVGEVVPAPVWVAAAIAVVDARRRRDTALLGMAAGAVAWFALVVVMGSALGYAALSRFLLPGAAVLCVLGGIGVVRLVRAVPRPVPVVVAVLALAIGVALVGYRARGIEGQLAEVDRRQADVDDLDAAVALVGGPERVRDCGGLVVTHDGVPRVAAAWKLDIPLAAVDGRISGSTGLAFVDAEATTAAPGRRWLRGVTPARTDEWAVYDRGCRP